MAGKTTPSRNRANWLERVRQVAWAGAIAIVLQLVTVLEPVDQIVWITQSRLATEPASGEIVFVGSDTDLANPEMPQGRRQLADMIRRLNTAGVDAVYVDYVFDQATDARTDADLNNALREFSGQAYLVRVLNTDFNGNRVLRGDTPLIADGVDQVALDAWVNYLGYTWYMPYAVEEDGVSLPNLPAQIAGVSGEPGEMFPITYNYELSSIPTYRLSDLMENPLRLRELAGKTVIISNSSERGIQPSNVPGHKAVPPSIISIYAAETLLAGDPHFVTGLPFILAAIAALLLAASIRQRSLRYTAYAVTSITALAAPFISAHFDVRISIAYALSVLLVYGLFRLRASWRENLRMVDSVTGLPTFAALEADRVVADTVPAIIVARIHRFEEVRRTLADELHAAYLQAIAARLKAATQDATIYIGQGHLIAWTMREKEPALLREHLEGLRALFSSPLVVGDQQVDVGITFGIDISPSPNVVRRLAAAVAVAEKTTETFEPIAVADSASQEDLIWNISLQARIDAALTNGEIYLAFQPKIMVQTGEIIGAEALVRWKDPVKGHIPPDNFIRQCETAGRMSQLTRFVLEEACKAGNMFAAEGLNLPIAVNISATLLHERGIVTMVRDVLAESGFEPRRLTLEITETYRISNLDLAADILGELSALGAKISMDDFGVGAASLEALLKLPFSELKIDRMFIAPMTSDPKAHGIVKSVLQMGRDLRIIVVAEGVEDAGTLTLLRDSGCLVAQGFAISRPVTFDKILDFHRSSRIEKLTNIV
ncbi:MAG: EAL domain-containing protein [Erythrobacter sp.]|nr:EAL domain-containing protein [Erythrobacter sp.]